MNPPVLKFTHPEVERQVFYAFDGDLTKAVVSAQYARELYRKYNSAEIASTNNANALAQAVAELQQVKRERDEARGALEYTRNQLSQGVKS